MPNETELYVVAKTWSNACLLAKALASGKLPIAPRHTDPKEAGKWCAWQNSHVAPGMPCEIVFHLRVEWHNGPDGKIFDYHPIAA